MRLIKANIAGLSSPLQQAEMKSILAGAWPPLKPLPVFKYETAEYRAAIEFDKRRGEWVCRKTSLPSNKVQELRGGLREITMALPHGEAEILTEEVEQAEQELEKDANRRLQAIHEWMENYESGALYCELRGYLSDSQQAELDDSLRLSLTARQLQFSAKNVAYVFDAISTAAGRFATLVEFAKRNKAKQGTSSRVQGVQDEEAVPEASSAMDQDRHSPANSPREFGGVPDSLFVGDEDAAEYPSNEDELPAVSITNVLPERDLASWSEQTAPDAASQESEIETSEIAETDSYSVVEHGYQGGRHFPEFPGFVERAQTGQLSAEGSAPSRFPALEISAFQAVCGILTLFAVLAFAVGLIVGRGPFGSRSREVPKSMLAGDVKPAATPVQAAESNSPAPAAAIPNDPAVAHRLDDGNLAAEKSKDPEPVPASELKSSVRPEINSDRSGGVGPLATTGPVPQLLNPTISIAPHLPRSSAILVTVPSRGSQPFRVSFPEKAVAATSSFAMTSQLSVLVSAEPRAATVRKPARLEAGELVSFVWPRYPRPEDRYGLAETIRVRAAVGQLGQVLDVKFLSGSISLLPATTRAIRQWHYRPTLLDKRPVTAQQDVTIEFRPPQYSSRVSSQHPFHR